MIARVQGRRLAWCFGSNAAAALARLDPYRAHVVADRLWRQHWRTSRSPLAWARLMMREVSEKSANASAHEQTIVDYGR